MMFIVRSAFWLSLVFSWMPFDRGQAVQGAVATARASCVADMASCRAIVAAAGNVLLTANAERAPAQHGVAKPKAAPPLADTLTAADRVTPWRGRPARSNS
jgi:hypothetical protein